MTEATTIVRGYLAADPRRNTTAQGYPVGNITLAHTPRKKNRDTGEWEDAGDTTWFEATLWGDASDVLSDLAKGDEVRVEGVPSVDVYERKDGGQGVKIKLTNAMVALVTRKSSREARQAARGATNGGQSNGWATPSANGPQVGAQQGWPDASDAPF